MTTKEAKRKGDTDGSQGIRQANLRMLSDKRGGPAILAKACGYAGASYISQLCNGLTYFSEKSARKIERALHLSAGYLDQPQGYSNTSPGAVPGYESLSAKDMTLLRETVLSVYQQTVERREAAGKAPLSPREFATLVLAQFDYARKTGGKIDEHMLDALIHHLSDPP